MYQKKAQWELEEQGPVLLCFYKFPVTADTLQRSRTFKATFKFITFLQRSLKHLQLIYNEELY